MSPKLETAVKAMRSLHLNPLHAWQSWDNFSEFTVRRLLVWATRQIGSRFANASPLKLPGYVYALSVIQEALNEIAVHRVRKGKVVRVPDEWVGKVPGRQQKDRRKACARNKRNARRRQLRREATFDLRAESPEQFSKAIRVR